MGEQGDRTTRRQFLELAAAGTAGAVAVSRGGTSAAVETGGRGHYKTYMPGRLGPLELKNRFIRSAAYEGAGSALGPTVGEPTQAYLDIHRSYAAGGVAMAITGYMAVMEFGRKGNAVGAFDDRFVPALTRVADVVHGLENGCKLVAEIGHDGQGSFGLRGPPASILSPEGIEWPDHIGPSGINWLGKHEGHALTAAEVARFCTDMAEAARRLNEAGFDGINIHGAHHYLINSFLSPYTNRRNDKYGGSMAKRVEIVREMVAKMREHVGSDFAILIKLNCDDGPADNGVEGETNLKNFPKLVKLVVEAGVDAIDISGQERPGDPLRVGLSKPDDQSFYEKYAAKLDIEVPVILGCGNKNVELLEEIFTRQRGRIDFFCLARPLIREPDLPARWLEGRGGAQCDCISCNLCFRELWTGEPTHCVQLKRLKKEQDRVDEVPQAGVSGA